MNKQIRQEYLDIAISTGIFTQEEVKTLSEVLDDCHNDKPGDYYLLFEEKVDDKRIGFIVVDRVAITAYAWDIFWLVVHKDFQGKGYGKKLLERVEKHVLEEKEKAIIRVETSTKMEYTHARNLYVKKGYIESGRVANFYSKGDDLIIYSKEIVREKV